jgi:Na+/proline symporter
MNSLILVLASLLYLAFLFGVAYWAEKRSGKGKSLVTNPYIYALSLAIYCTAWTFYGSVGRAVGYGIEYLSVYIYPTLMMPLWWLVIRKIIRISKVYRITSIADFISSRYGKNVTLGIIVTLVSLVGVLPYIAIQLKAISSSFRILTRTDSPSNSHIFLMTLLSISQWVWGYLPLFLVQEKSTLPSAMKEWWQPLPLNQSSKRWLLS